MFYEVFSGAREVSDFIANFFYCYLYGPMINFHACLAELSTN